MLLMELQQQTLTTSASGGTVQKNLTVNKSWKVTFSVFIKKGTTDGVSF